MRVVAKKIFSHQNGAIGNTTIFTSSGGGDYRISGYCILVNNTHSAAIAFQWNDGVQAEDSASLTGGTLSSSTSGPLPGFVDIPVHLGENQSIVAYALSIGTQSSDFNAYVTVEELNGPQF